jgi:hypothetical protein
VTSVPGGGPTIRNVGRVMKLIPQLAMTVPSPRNDPRWVS